MPSPDAAPKCLTEADAFRDVSRGDPKPYALKGDDLVKARLTAESWRLEIISDVQERALDALVPNLILQPIVENAIKHGVNKTEGVGRIALRGRIEGGQLVLSVENNAPFVEGSGGIGVGVRNTRARLTHLYGDDQSFELRSGDSTTPATIAEIRLPYHTRADLRTSAVVSIA